MAIKGLTDKKAVFPRIGKLRKGGTKSGNRPGKDLDHFRFDSSDPGAVAAFTAAYGDEPREINVRLPYPTLEENFQTAMERYGAGGIEARCDREFLQGVRVNGKFVKCFPGKSPCQRDETKKDNGCGCKEVGRLNLIIPELERFAYVTAETHSINDIVNLTQQLTAIEMTFGQLNCIPLVLTRRPEQISCPSNDGGRARREKWMLSIEISPQWASKQIAARDRVALQQAAVAALAPGAPLTLPAAGEDFEANPTPEPLPTYDFAQSELWLKMRNAFHAINDAGEIARYEARAMGLIADGTLPPQASTMVAQLVEKAYQKLSDRSIPTMPTVRMPAAPAPAQPGPEPAIDIDPNWQQGQLWVDLKREAERAPSEDLEAYGRQVEAFIQSGELPPAAGPAMQRIISRRLTDFPNTVEAEVVA
jgi:hypothetical protein